MRLMCTALLLAWVRPIQADSVLDPYWQYGENRIANPMSFERRDKSSEQLSDFQRQHKGGAILTTSAGTPVGDVLNSLTVGPRGPMLLQDFVFLDVMSKFNRERIPERVVHAKGAGAFGEFVVTHDITQYTKAKVFSKIGKVTKMAVRFSQSFGQAGSADTTRDVRGFALKFYTDEGNWDLAGLNMPIWGFRDPLLFLDFNHRLKRNPVTHLTDHDAVWDLYTLEPQSMHQIMFLYSDRGTPNGHRHINGFGVNVFKLVNATGSAVYCKFHFKSDQGVQNLDADVAEQLKGSQPDYNIKDLYDAIAEGNYPSWTSYVQVMTFAEAEAFCFNPFDVTKVWPQAEYPLLPVGKFVLNRNPNNFFAEVEQLAFNPASLVPGIEPSPDLSLQGRLFAYGDAQHYRLGVNNGQIPVNCPIAAVRNYQRDGFMTVTDNQGGAPNYYPNSFGGPVDNPKYLDSAYQVSGDVGRYNDTGDDYYAQPTIFWTKVLDEGGRHRLVQNLAKDVFKANEFIQKRVVKMVGNVHVDFGQLVAKALAQLKLNQQNAN